MFDTIKALYAGFVGRLEAYPEARRLVWLLLVVFGFGWLAAAFAAWISYPAYRSMVDYLPGASTVAALFTGGVAAFLYFSLAYLAGYLVERWRGVEPARRDYTALGARILTVAALLFLAADVSMNLTGAEVRADDAAGNAGAFQMPAGSVERQAMRARIEAIEAGQVGGYGWRDPAGKWHLNQSGKAAIRQAAASVRRIEVADSIRAAAALTVWQESRQDVERTRTRARNVLRGAVYAVYVIMFLLCVVQAYAVEVMQAAAGTSGRQGFADPARFSFSGQSHSDEAGRPVVAGYGSGSGQASDQRVCLNCGKSFSPRVTWQKYCTEPCRVEAWEGKTGKTLQR